MVLPLCSFPLWSIYPSQLKRQILSPPWFLRSVRSPFFWIPSTYYDAWHKVMLLIMLFIWKNEMRVHIFYLLNISLDYCHICCLPINESEKVKVKLLSRVQLFATPWTVTYQTSPTMGFFRQECWSRLPFPSPRIFPTQGSNSGLLRFRQTLYHLSHQMVNCRSNSLWTLLLLFKILDLISLFIY